MELDTLRDLYIHELKDLYSAEKQLVKALPKVAKAATNPDLKAGIEAHLEQTVEHVNRLESLLENMGENTRGPKCKGMEGLIEEGEQLIAEEPNEEVLDAGIIAGAQKIEHYEIAGYGCVRSYAELLGEEEAVSVLQTTLDEESATDKKLTELALTIINLAAADREGEGHDEEEEGELVGAATRGGAKGRSQSPGVGSQKGARGTQRTRARRSRR
jgi:ferritin-like metal-binding protein YciE